MLIYRDWRPVVAAAAVIAVHHVLFDRLQAAGMGTYCLTEPDFLRVMVHAGYLVVQTGFEVYMALLMRGAANQGEELSRLVEHVQASGRVALDVHDMPAGTRAGRELKDALMSPHETLQTVRRSIGSIQVASSEIASGSLDLSGRTEQTAGHLQQTASSMVQLSGTVQQTADSARNASALAGSAAEVAQRGGQVVASIRADPTSFNPIIARDETAELIGDLMQGRLVRVNRATFDLEPWLAERWESSADGRTHTLHLRAGLTWSDGVPLTSADVLFSLQAAFDARSKSTVADRKSTRLNSSH